MEVVCCRRASWKQCAALREHFRLKAQRAERPALKHRICAQHCTLQAQHRLAWRAPDRDCRHSPPSQRRLPQGTTKAYEVRFVAKGHELDASYPPRWTDATQLRENWSTERACQTHSRCCAATSSRPESGAAMCTAHRENMMVFCERTRSAGWLVATPAGFPEIVAGFFGAQGLGPTRGSLLFFGGLFTAVPDITAVIHDDDCHLREVQRASSQPRCRFHR